MAEGKVPDVQFVVAHSERLHMTFLARVKERYVDWYIADEDCSGVKHWKHLTDRNTPGTFERAILSAGLHQSIADFGEECPTVELALFRLGETEMEVTGEEQS